MSHTATQGLGLSHPKIMEAGALAQHLLRLRSGLPVPCVVFTNGCYDILHPGHVDLLHRAKKMGDVLVLALNTDASVRRLGKGADRPINAWAVRAFVAAHLECVDFVTSFDEDTPLELVRLLQPDVLVKGGDWPVGRIVGGDVVQAYGGTVHSLPLLQGYSTTSLVEKIRQ